jgi:hypothetical protein
MKSRDDHDWRTGGLADWRTGGLAGWRAGGLAGWRAGGLAGERYAWVMSTSQETPYRSTHMPNSSPQTCFCIGIVAVPPADSFSK